MNRVRRKKIQAIFDQLTDIKERLEELNDEEQECFGNIPENLQGSERYEAAEEAASALEEAVSSFDDLMEYLDNAMSV